MNYGSAPGVVATRDALAGFRRAADTGITTRMIGTTTVPALSVRATPGTVGLTLLPEAMAMIVTTVARDVKFELRHSVAGNLIALTGAAWSDLASSEAQWDVAATGVSGGAVVASCYLSGGRSETLFFSRHVVVAQPSADVLCVTAQALTPGGAEVCVGLTWQETYP